MLIKGASDTLHRYKVVVVMPCILPFPCALSTVTGWVFLRLWSENIMCTHMARNDAETSRVSLYHDDVIKWEHFPCYWTFVKGTFSLICAWTNAWANNRGPGDLGYHRAYYDATVTIADQLYGLAMKYVTVISPPAGNEYATDSTQSIVLIFIMPTNCQLGWPIKGC